MGKYVLKSDVKAQEFSHKYLPKDIPYNVKMAKTFMKMIFLYLGELIPSSYLSSSKPI